MGWTRWLVVAYSLGFSFIFGSFAYGLLKAPIAKSNGDRIRWLIMAALSFMGLMFAAGWTMGAFIDRDVAQQLVRFVVIFATFPLGLIVFKFMRKYWPWHRS